MKNQKIIWTPHPGPQNEALKRIEREILYGGARGGGKTDAGLAWLLRHIKNPQYRALIIRKNADDLSDWVDRARVMYKGTGAIFAYRPAVISFPSGATFKTGHLKDEGAYTKYQGHEYQRMVIEELTQIPTEERYLKLISSCRSTISVKPQVFATTNPGGLGHAWVKTRFVDTIQAGKTYVDPQTTQTRVFIPARVKDNPTLVNNDPGYVKFLDGLPEQLRKAWRDGDWDIVAGQVFTEWRRDLHVVKPFAVPQEWKKWTALDWGINNPSAVGWYAQNFDGRTYLYRELYLNGMDFHKLFGRPLTPKRLARVIIGMTKKHKETTEYCVADPSLWNKTILGEKRTKPEGESIAEIMIDVGLNLYRGDNDRLNGLGRYREALAIAPDQKPWYQVFSTCTDTIRTIPALPYDMRKTEDVDTDAEDHAYDRDRYFFMSRPIRPIKMQTPKLSNIGRAYREATRKWEEPNDEEETDIYQDYL